MGISGIGAGASYSTLKTFQQLNRDVHTQGVEQASRISKEAGDYSRVSNFGNETKIGTSKFQRGNETIATIGENKTSELMDKAKSYYAVSNFGTETKLGSSKFQQANAQVSAKFAAVASAYKQAASLGSVSRGATVDIGA
ncbi:MAG: hypothetical protein MR959_10545 [Selenomonas bovis]|nr:hypothetical protein [Selenomonas bovis]